MIKFFPRFFLFLFLSVPLYAQDFSAGQQFSQQGVRFRNEGNYAESERELLKALEQEPSNADYHFELANTYAAFYDAWKKRDKERSGLMLDRAAYQFEQAAMIRPDFTAAHFNLGVIYKNKGEYEQARDKFRNVLALDPASTAAWMQIGAIYEAQGFFDEAGDAYKKAKEIDPFNSNIQSAIADLENTEVQYRDEHRQSEMAERLNLMNRNFRYNAFSSAGDYEKDRRLSQQDAQGMGSAIPYLASMLADEFMKWQERRRENSGGE